MRMVRGDAPGDPNTFRIRQSNRLVDTLLEATDGITLAAVFIGLITLLGAGIGLMNIMLVSVSERTRKLERERVWARRVARFGLNLIEVLVIGQIGGAVGILLGLGAGNAIAIYFETPFCAVGMGHGRGRLVLAHQPGLRLLSCQACRQIGSHRRPWP